MPSKTAIITGAGGTLCSVMTLDLARKGYAVALLGRTLSKLETVAERICQDGGSARCIAVDVTDIAAVRAAGEQVLAELGPCRVLINGAGGKLPGGIMSQTTFSPDELKPDTDTLGFFNSDLDVFRAELDLNICGTAIPSQVFGKQMTGAGGGSIVNFASMTSYRPLSKVPGYAAAKSAIVNYTQWLSAYLAPANIRVNAIAPGFIVNERSRKLLYNEDGTPSPRGAQVLGHTPMNRFGEANELLGALNYFIDDTASGFVTGVTLPVDGGFLACPGV
ncbi:MAG: SDR family NAD(P)-dependent oxidoreductase [Opitutales bacterium]